MDMARYEVAPIGWVESPLVDRDVAPRQGDEGAPDAWLVFDRPNPIGLHHVRILAIGDTRVRVRNLEALDTTPILDVKPVLEPRAQHRG